jgi:hypothetical protein
MVSRVWTGDKNKVILEAESMCLGDVSTGCSPTAVLSVRSMTLTLLTLLLSGCGSQQGCLEQNFPPELVSKVYSDFKIDITDWEVPAGWTAPTRVGLVFCRQGGVDAEVAKFCEQKITKALAARGFEIDPNEQTELTICIVKAAEIHRPVRSAKVRIAATFCPRLRSGQASEEGSEPAMLGVADGIEARPDLSSGVWMPKSAYFRAAQYAIAKLMDQLDNIPKRSPSQG